MIQLNFKKIEEDAKLPTKSLEADAGVDFYALENTGMISPFDVTLVRTGLIWEPKFDENIIESTIDTFFNIFMKIEDRSGMAVKTPFHVKAGVIDQTYRGEIKVVLVNISKSEFFSIEKGQKFAQGIIHIIPKIAISESSVNINTDRGENGFGSSGN